MSQEYPPPPGWQPSRPVDVEPEGAAPGGDGPAHQPPLPVGPGGTWHSRAAHKPGAIPLRPLTLSDMYDAAFKIIRFNPKATVGSAVLVAAVAMAIPVLVTALLGSLLDLSTAGDALNASPTEPAPVMSEEEITGMVGVVGSLVVGSILQAIGLILVGGMIAHVVAAASIGRRLSLGEAWAATHGKRWRLIGLTVLLGLATTAILAVYVLMWVAVVSASGGWQVPLVFGLVSVPTFFAFLVWFWVRVYYLPVPSLMLEDLGIFAAIGRGFGLTRRSFWRTFGIALLTFVIAQIAGSMLSAPVSIVSQGLLLGGLPGEAGVFLLIIGQALASVIAAAFVAPFTTSVATLQYIDLRMRTEAFDVVLMQRAGITQS